MKNIGLLGIFVLPHFSVKYSECKGGSSSSSRSSYSSSRSSSSYSRPSSSYSRSSSSSSSYSRSSSSLSSLSRYLPTFSSPKCNTYKVNSDRGRNTPPKEILKHKPDNLNFPL